jgi:oligopeptide transport system ATP-binding protein
MQPPLLQIEDLKTYFYTSNGVVKAVDGISYSVHEGETVAIVGESGCGKSVSALSVMRLVPSPPGKTVNGKVIYQGNDILKASDSEMRKIRGKQIAMVFQDPMTSLNPVLTIKYQLVEPMKLHLNLTEAQCVDRAVELLDLVGISDGHKRLDDYPHQFSGGMRQRVMIAMALSCDPKLIIADEPTTNLDVTIQAQILEVMEKVIEETKTAMVIITHNLGVVARYADTVNIMYAGKIVESGTCEEIFKNVRHPYTEGLLQSVPRLDARAERLQPIPGLPPDLRNLPPGCRFADRCKYVHAKCTEAMPELETVSDSHVSACWIKDTIGVKS